MISVAAPSNANCVLPPRRSRGTLLCRGGTALSRGRCFVEGALPFWHYGQILGFSSSCTVISSSFLPLFYNFCFFTVFCLVSRRIIPAFLQLFPIIYKFYGKTAFCKKLFTVILFERLPLHADSYAIATYFSKSNGKTP